MRKSFTKIICATVAAISVLSLTALSACGTKWSGVSKDNSYESVSSNGGFVVETGDYVYFVNGVSAYTANNTFGSVVKGSLQRIKKTDLSAHNYSSTETVVPSVIYSGRYNAGIYIYGDYVYYTTPTTAKNIDGEVQNSKLDFKRTRLDGKNTTEKQFFRSDSNSIDYRYVEVDGTVYILYVLDENLYGTSAKNIHAVNCSTGKNTLLAYNVGSCFFDTEDAENPYVYYTMGVYANILDSSSQVRYNQIYRVRADEQRDSEKYDFSYVDGYNASSDPLYVNCGYHVFDGIGNVEYTNHGLGQFNYGYGENKQYTITNSDYEYDIKWYKNGTLYYTREELRGDGDGIARLYTLTDGQINPATEDGKVKSEWDAISANAEQVPFLDDGDTTEYTYVEMADRDDGNKVKLYALNASSGGLTKQVVENGKLGDKVRMCEDASVQIFAVREEGGHVNAYYTYSDGVYRLSIDGTYDDYVKLPVDEDAKVEYESVQILNLYANANWYTPEFVGNTLIFASEISNMSDYDYIMACDLSGSDGVMTNAEIKALNEKFEGVTDKINKYGEDDDDKIYEHLPNALKYLFHTGDTEYLDELVKAYKDIENKSDVYSEQSVAVYKDFAKCENDWAEYADDTRTVNGETVTANFSEYYYSVLGKMTDKDADGLKADYRSDYMESYPVKEVGWWEGLSAGAKAGFIIGVVVGGLGIIAGVTVLTIWLLRRKKNGILGESDEKTSKVDITDDKDMNVYGDENNEQ